MKDSVAAPKALGPLNRRVHSPTVLRILLVVFVVTAIAFSRDGKRLAVASGEPAKSGFVKLFAVIEAGPKFEAKGEITGAKDVQYALDFAPDHKTLAIAGYDRIIRMWDTEALAKGDRPLDLRRKSLFLGANPRVLSPFRTASENVAVRERN